MKIPVIIEIPKDCKIKYEIDKSGKLMVDRILELNYPFNYGYIPNTLWEDGDALDAVVIGDFTLYPQSVINVEPIAVVKMYDDGVSDYKIICRVNNDHFEEYWNTIKEFLEVYKKGVRIDGYDVEKEAIEKAITDAKIAYVVRP